MKKLITLFAVITLFWVNNAFSQGWTTQTTGLAGSVNLSSVHFISATTGLAVGSGGSIIKTTNGGTNWVTKTSLTANALTSVKFIDANNAIAVGQFGIILYSTNAGETWNNQTTGTNLTGVFFPSATVGYACGSTGTVLKSTNAGVNWSALTTGSTVNFTGVNFTSESEGYVVGANGTVLKTTNGGTNWITLTSGTTNALTSANFVSTNGWICGANATMRKTTNSGTNWAAQTLPGGGGGTNVTCVFFLDANTGYAVGQGARINYTVNGGTAWGTQTAGGGGFNNYNGIFMVNGTTGWIVGDGATVLKTTTGGLTVPSAPTLQSPANGASNVVVTPTFQWSAVTGATSYKIQVSTVSNFAVIVDSAIVATNSYTIAAGILQPATGYFWRVNASNAIGTSTYSTTFNFSTVLNLPPTPTLVSPPNGQSGVSLTPSLIWNSLTGVTSFQIQVSTQANFSTITDSATVAGNLNIYNVPAGRLGLATNYNWRVRAINASGTGAWSSSFSFFTLAVGVNLVSSEVPKEFKLFNNYPNPFNPSTKIKFSVPKSEYVTLRIFDNSGKVVSQLVNGNLSAGTYETELNASSLSSGVYYYKFESASYSDTKRMMLIK
ncbi:MAG: T9SS type A sorting domain-containing protein [Ignavibacteria bacterium]|nr:T9SS type A sorting domain-containing protein [Ignavibacteria bacterium]